MTRRTVFLLAAVAAAMLLASGVALAETVVCQAGLPCVGTGAADDITGTTGDDDIRALGGPDTISSRGGKDKILPGGGPDSSDGGHRNDVYRFADTWGQDTIAPMPQAGTKWTSP